MTSGEPTDVFLVKGLKGLDDGFQRKSNSKAGFIEKALHEALREKYVFCSTKQTIMTNSVRPYI